MMPNSLLSQALSNIHLHCPATPVRRTAFQVTPLFQGLTIDGCGKHHD
jgi:hypothetical protein